MFDYSPDNPLIPTFLRVVVGIEILVVLAGGVLLFFFPSEASKVWPWNIPPFNSRLVGSVYLAALVPLIIVSLVPRWRPGWLTLWMILVFTALVMLAMFMHHASFAWDRPATYMVFWPLYIFLPVNTAVFLFLYRKNGVTKLTYNGSSTLRISMMAFALFSFVYGLGLLFAPEAVTGFWPWKVDALHGRMYSAAFITPAVGAWLLCSRPQIASEYVTIGANLIAGGLLPIFGTIWTNLNVPVARQFDFASAGTLVFFAIFFLAGTMGLILTLSALRQSKTT